MAFEKILVYLGLSYFPRQKKKLFIVYKIKLLIYLWHLHNPEKVTQKNPGKAILLNIISSGTENIILAFRWLK